MFVSLGTWMYSSHNDSVNLQFHRLNKLYLILTVIFVLLFVSACSAMSYNTYSRFIPTFLETKPTVRSYKETLINRNTIEFSTFLRTSPSGVKSLTKY